MSQVVEDTDLEGAEDEEEREPRPVVAGLASVVSGLLLEGIARGPFSIGAWALKSLGVAALYLAWTVLWRFYQGGRQSGDEDRSNPLM